MRLLLGLASAGSADLPGKVTVHAQALVPAAFGVELAREHAAMAYRGTEGRAAVAGHGDRDIRITGPHVERVHEVHVLAVGEPLEDGAVPGRRRGALHPAP